MHHPGDIGIEDWITDILVVVNVLCAVNSKDPKYREGKKEFKPVVETSDSEKIVVGGLVH